MSLPHAPKPAKLVMSILYREEEVLAHGLELLKEKFGAWDLIETKIPFQETVYYYPEMGEPLFRSFLSFQNLILRENLPQIKLWTNQIENSLAKEDGRRKLNMDPGYLTDAQFVLATGKNYSHRIYLGEGIFGTLTLIFMKGKFQPQSWTYPDYQRDPILGLLHRMRDVYLMKS